MRRHTLTIITVLGLATGPSALFTGTALGSVVSPDAQDANAIALAKQNVDLRSPDARDSGRVVVVQPQTSPAVDLRSPDARDAARFTSQPQTPTRVDLRSPDTRDVANNVRFVSVPPPVVVSNPSSSGFEWGDAGIGAGGAVLIALLAFGAGIGIQHHRRHTHTPLAG
jgi:hypothetical protein